MEELWTLENLGVAVAGLLTLLGWVLGSGAVRRRRVALAIYHAYNIMEDVANELRKEGQATLPAEAKVRAALGHANAWMVAQGWRALKPGEEDVAMLTFRSLHGAQKAAASRESAAERHSRV